MNKIKVLYSPSEKRVIYNDGLGSITLQLNDNFEVVKNIHEAPIDIETMSKSFSNTGIGFISREIEKYWHELKQ